MTMMTSSSAEPTSYLLRLSNGDTRQAQWVLGTEEEGVGFFGEYFCPCPDTAAGAEPTEEVAEWVADVLSVTDIELTLIDDQGHWSVTITR
jgi:hypothetical protein